MLAETKPHLNEKQAFGGIKSCPICISELNGWQESKWYLLQDICTRMTAVGRANDKKKCHEVRKKAWCSVLLPSYPLSSRILV